MCAADAQQARLFTPARAGTEPEPLKMDCMDSRGHYLWQPIRQTRQVPQEGRWQQ